MVQQPGLLRLIKAPSAKIPVRRACAWQELQSQLATVEAHPVRLFCSEGFAQLAASRKPQAQVFPQLRVLMKIQSFGALTSDLPVE